VNIKQLIELRKKVGKTQADVAKILGVTTRTITSWEAGPDKEFPHYQARAIINYFKPLLLKDIISDMTEQAFKKINSEYVGIWLVDTEEAECFVLPDTQYLHFLPNVRNTGTSIPLVDISLTTYPLQSGETVNLGGDAILHHPAKKYKGNRAAALLRDGQCESLLHVPAFNPSPLGPQPILMVSFENKLDAKEQVIMPSKEEPLRKIYTEEDESSAKALANEYKERLMPDLELLDLI